MKTNFKNPILKEKIRCSEKGCRRLAIMLRCKIPYCKIHAPYFKPNRYSGKYSKGGKRLNVR